MKPSQRAAQTPASPLPGSRTSADPATTALLAAAREIFEAGGLPALSVRGVAEAAGCTTMQVYSRLGGKDGLLQALFDEGFEALSSAQQAVPKALPAAERVRRLCHEYLRIAAERPHHYALMLGAHSGDFKPPPASQARALATLAISSMRWGHALPPTQDREQRALEVAHQILAFCHGWAMLSATRVVDGSRTAVIDRAVAALLGKDPT
ncbi:MAG: TetR/AcrR family transcriptional regulator [Aquincola sp.]|nr:TetR/AcrR family transcriptional regulator [Aquincola sp.]